MEQVRVRVSAGAHTFHPRACSRLGLLPMHRTVSCCLSPAVSRERPGPPTETTTAASSGAQCLSVPRAQVTSTALPYQADPQGLYQKNSGAPVPKLSTPLEQVPGEQSRTGRHRHSCSPLPHCFCQVRDLLFLSMLFRVLPTPGSLPSLQADVLPCQTAA